MLSTRSRPVTQLPPLKVGEVRVEKGYFSPIPEITIPFAVIEGEKTGPCLLATSAVHGAEFSYCQDP